MNMMAEDVDEIEVEVEEEQDAGGVNPNIQDQLRGAATGATASNESEEEEELTPEQKVLKYLESDEELKNYGESVQKRINKLTYQWKEAERRENAAVQYAQSVQQRMRQLELERLHNDTAFIGEYKERVKAQLKTAQQLHKTAYETNDADLLAESSQNLARLAAELAQAEQNEQRMKRRIPQQQQPGNNWQEPPQQRPQQQPRQVPQRPVPDAKAESWAEKNTWFGEDEIMTGAAMQIHNSLINEGYAPESDVYYQEIDRRMRSNFPHKFKRPRQSGEQTVTVGSNAPIRKGGKKQVKLTASQASIARRLGVSLEEYAKYV